jgi:hypothetical protein
LHATPSRGGDEISMPEAAAIFRRRNAR